MQTLVREGSLLVKLRNSTITVQSLTNGCAWDAVAAFANCGRALAHVRGSYGPKGDFRSTTGKSSYSITSYGVNNRRNGDL